MIRRFLYGITKGALGLIFQTVAVSLMLGTGWGRESAQDSPSTDQPWIGKKAPAIELPSVGGEKVSLGSFTGQKVVILHFAASW